MDVCNTCGGEHEGKCVELALEPGAVSELAGAYSFFLKLFKGLDDQDWAIEQLCKGGAWKLTRCVKSR